MSVTSSTNAGNEKCREDMLRSPGLDGSIILKRICRKKMLRYSLDCKESGQVSKKCVCSGVLLSVSSNNKIP